MLSYQHIYHAGNFADVQKHALLIRLLKTLTDAPRPLHLLDTHAGRGFYDLDAVEAQKTGEHLFGVTPLWAERPSFPAPCLIGDYLEVVARYNKTAALTRYPGSARIARDLLRATDTLIAAERHPREFQELEKAFRRDDRAMTDLFHDDGLRGLTAAAPAGDARGVIVIDPSYEMKNDYTDIPHALIEALPDWPDAVVLIWYPILPAGLHSDLLAALQGQPGIVSQLRLTTPPRPGYRMEGSGIIVINCPWGNATMTALTQDIANALTSTCGEVIAEVFAL